MEFSFPIHWVFWDNKHTVSDLSSYFIFHSVCDKSMGTFKGKKMKLELFNDFPGVKRTLIVGCFVGFEVKQPGFAHLSYFEFILSLDAEKADERTKVTVVEKIWYYFSSCIGFTRVEVIIFLMIPSWKIKLRTLVSFLYSIF